VVVVVVVVVAVESAKGATGKKKRDQHPWKAHTHAQHAHAHTPTHLLRHLRGVLGEELHQVLVLHQPVPLHHLHVRLGPAELPDLGQEVVAGLGHLFRFDFILIRFDG
jgi:hypothetical protein